MSTIKKSTLQIAYLTTNDPNDRRSWSGTQYYMARALEKHCGVVSFLGPIRSKTAIFDKIIAKGLWACIRKRYLYNHTISLSKYIARTVQQRLVGKHFDVIFAPAGSTAIAHLQTVLPIVYVSDTTFRLVLNYHPEFLNPLSSSILQADYIEKAAINKSTLALFSSTWAARSAIQDYEAPRHKVRVMPFGANLETWPAPEDSSRDCAGPCRLLFIGREWENKGGPIAFDAMLELERLGVNVELIIVGCKPHRKYAHKNVKVFRYLDKEKNEDRQTLDTLYRSATFFLLPTRMECFGIVFCEANAFGLPVIATDTGGISEIVRSGDNGCLLPLSAHGVDYAQVILEALSQKGKYSDLRRRSRESFEERLNWDAWGQGVCNLLSGIV